MNGESIHSLAHDYDLSLHQTEGVLREIFNAYINEKAISATNLQPTQEIKGLPN
jgi:hypothetical protein